MGNDFLLHTNVFSSTIRNSKQEVNFFKQAPCLYGVKKTENAALHKPENSPPANQTHTTSPSLQNQDLSMSQIAARLGYF